MALSNDIVWEVRPTVGSDTNGGGFVSGATGTDFSQQNSPQQSYTDLVAATTTTITSVARAFSSVDVGNLINITSGSGWTTGRYKITGVTGSTATVDRAIATASSTGGTGKLGGAMATVNPLLTLSLDLKVYVKATGTYTINARQDVTLNLWMIGYTTTRGDNGRVTITTTTNPDPVFLFFNGVDVVLENISASDSSASRKPFMYIQGDTGYFSYNNCKFDGFVNAFNTNGHVINHLLFRATEIVNSTGNGISLETCHSAIIDDCYIHSNTTNGINWSGGGGTLVINRSVIKSNTIGINNTTDNFGTSAGSIFIFNSAIINNSGDGVHDLGSGTNYPQLLQIQNTIIDSNGGYGVNVANTTAALRHQFGGANAYRSNTSGDRNNYPTFSTDVTLTGDPFTARASDDFSLNNTSGAGAACKAVGFPLVFP